MSGWLFAAFLAGSALAAPPTECESSAITDLTCSSTITGSLSGSGDPDLEYYTCGSPYSPLTQSGPEAIYGFECQVSGSVTMDISGLSCDLDIYILDDTCDPDTGCETGSTEAGTSNDSITFTCTAGQMYYIVVEGYGYGYSSCSGTENFTLTFDVSASTGCNEDCDDGVDNDLDGKKDCLDTDCATDPACDSCPDGDGDGYDPTSCGGTDCDDTNAAVYPGATETCNSVDDDCDGTVDEGVTYTYYRDADRDGYGTPTTTTSSCSSTAPTGYVSNSSDCDDSNKNINPSKAETCDGVDNDCDGSIDEGLSTTYYRDSDGDGYGDSATSTTACSRPTGYVATSTDCDDTRSTVYPGATETCNSRDDDCDGSIDEGVTSTWYRDADGDGYGTSTSTTTGCTAPTGYVGNSTDCNDSSASIKPGATETCNSIDDDCDGTIDEDVKTTYYRDADGDGYGTSATSTTACSAPTGYVTSSTDCDDTKKAVNPGATETCNSVDDDCDGTVDDGVGSTWYRDADGDGYGTSSTSMTACSAPTGYVATSTDCDDTRSTVYPGATETCNSRDDDCDGSVDESPASGAPTWYRDADGDGYGTSSTSTTSCSKPTGYVSTSTDCDDTKSAINPGATETCNSVDDDCDSSVDEGVTTTYYRDADSDGYGGTSSTTGCSAPSGYVATSTDCDDTRASVYPGATETCNSRDDDCDGTVDDGVKTTYYRDADGDGYGTSSTTSAACSAPSGYVSNSTDCDDSSASDYPGAPEVVNNGDDEDCDGVDSCYRDSDKDGYGSTTVVDSADLDCSDTSESGVSTDCSDSDATTYPGATEICDGIDNDCDGTIDDSATGMGTWYRDADSDGYGDAATSTSSCSKPTGYVNNSTDCNDASAAVSPAATETCNSIDDDCDGTVDEGVKTTYYRDADSDGYGTSAVTSDACSAPSGYVSSSTDCDDSKSAVFPGATETCNSVDDDCDGTIDEGVKTTYYADADSDGYGNAASTTTGCSAPSGYVSTSTDCDDTRASVYPGATETCNSRDDDCDGTVDEGVKTTFYRDADADGYGNAASTTSDCSAPTGYVASSTDCDDATSTTYPGATEICNGVDDDCDGTIDDSATGMATWYADADSDGYGDASSTTSSCSKPSGYVADATDCDDSAAAVNPAAAEKCNSVDDDCDGTVDESDASDALTWYADADSDGYGGTSTTKACTEPSGYEATATDCDDSNASVHPGAAEACNSVDDDCDGTVDEGVTTTYYADTDADGYGDAAATTDACSTPTGYVGDDTDCDDLSDAIHPGAAEYCNTLDDDCDGVVDEDDAVDGATWYADADDDGFGDPSSTTTACDAPTGFGSDATDCDDRDATAFPGAPEVAYDGIDQDCDGSDWIDVDGDGHDADFAGGDDCDDSDADVYPGAVETADGVDESCEGVVDEGTEYYDDDGDGYTESGGDCDDATGDVAPNGAEDCDGVDDDCDGLTDDGTDCYDDDADGWTEADGDCNDADGAVSPDAAETDANGIDDDCDGSVDSGAYDPDGDGYTAEGGDCVPDDAASYPGAPETADGVDNDCDKTTDEGTDVYDDDGDGLSDEAGDCDDADDEVFDGAAEDATNGVDDDCDGVVDEGGVSTDDDGDGYTEEGGDCDDADDTVSPGEPESDNDRDDDCDEAVDEDFADVDGDGYTVDLGDCDDLDGWTNPGAEEFCDGLDNNCNGTADEACADQGEPPVEDRKCGCDSSTSPGLGLLPLLALILVRRGRGRDGRGRGLPARG